MSQSHPYHSLQLPRGVPFELKPSPGKGWGAFATRRIERGALILEEKALFVIQKSHEKITERDIWTAVCQLESTEQKQLMCLRSNPFEPLSHTMAENSFAVSSSNRFQPNSSTVHGLFLLQSRFNHSCLPNSKVPSTDGETLASYAIKDIAAGEEITFCYNSDFELRVRHDRRQVLRFECDCKACLPGSQFQQLSDIRRTLIRGLQYLTLGVDFEEKRPGSVSPLIIDPKLKKAAEEFTISLSSRLIYNLLTLYLLEEEGLLDHFMFERLYPGILQITTLFETESNARLARLAIAQKSCLEKLCMAFKLYDQVDAADHAISVGLRTLQGRSPIP